MGVREQTVAIWAQFLHEIGSATESAFTMLPLAGEMVPSDELPALSDTHTGEGLQEVRAVPHGGACL